MLPGVPLRCPSVPSPHPAGAFCTPWPTAAPGCQTLLVLALPRVTQHFFSRAFRKWSCSFFLCFLRRFGCAGAVGGPGIMCLASRAAGGRRGQWAATSPAPGAPYGAARGAALLPAPSVAGAVGQRLQLHRSLARHCAVVLPEPCCVPQGSCIGHPGPAGGVWGELRTSCSTHHEWLNDGLIVMSGKK